MATKIVTKNSSTASAVPTASDLVQGELAVNVADKRLFTEDNAGAIVELGTNPSTLTVTGEITANGGIALGDNDKATFGAGDDLQIYHDGSNSYIVDAGTGDLYFRSASNLYIGNAAGTQSYITAADGGAVDLRYNGSAKLATTSTGIDVTGTATMDGLTVQTTNGLNAVLESANSYQYLQFKNSAETNNYLGFVEDDFSVTAANKKYLQVAGNGDISFYEDTGTTPKFFWDASAESLGIGTSSPADNLDISLNNNTGAVVGVQIHNTNAGTTSNFAGIITTAVNGTVGMRVQAASVAGLSAATFGSTTSHPARFVTADVERMRISSSGNVGIGTSSPQAKLDVSDVGNFSTGYGTFTGDGLHIQCNGTGGVGAFTGGISFSRISADNNSRAAGIAGVQGADADQVGLAFFTHPSATTSDSLVEAMRIDASGDLNVGCTDGNSLYNNTGTNDGVGIRGNGQIQQAVYQDVVHYANRTGNDGDIINLRKDGTSVGSIANQGADILINAAGTGRLGSGGVEYFKWDSNQFYPAVDNARDLGFALLRWDDIYATNGTINTSDRNEKQDIAELSDAEQRVAVAAKGLLRKFRWKDSVAEKGEDARIHFGIIAQDLQDAFAAEGLDAGDYAMFISTTWTDEETNEEKTRMGVRYSELLAFIIAAI